MSWSDGSRRTYNNNSIKLKTSVIRSNLCDYSDAYILVRGTMTITGARADDAAKQTVFKNCAPFTQCIRN